MIDKFCGVNDVLYQVLIDAFNADDWGMNFTQFLAKAKEEIDFYLDEAINDEAINEE